MANGLLAEIRDADNYPAWASDREALCLEENDLVTITDDSANWINLPVRVKDVNCDLSGKHPLVNLNGQQYVAAMFDDDVGERVTPAPTFLQFPRLEGANTELLVPTVFRRGAATNTSAEIEIRNYSTAARFRKIEVSDQSNMANPAIIMQGTVNEPNALLDPVVRLTRATQAGAATKYVRVAHSSSGEQYGAYSNVLMVTFADSAGGGGTGDQPPPNTGGIGGGSTCFLAGTMILMADGSEKPIELIEKHDLVFAHDGLGNLVAKPVIEVFEHQAGSYLRVWRENEAKPVLVTPEHPYRTARNEFAPIGEFVVGDLVISHVKGERRARRITRIEAVEQQTTVYNFHVADLETYVADGDEVHNVKPVVLNTA